jgi:hypothetical protein
LKSPLKYNHSFFLPIRILCLFACFCIAFNGHSQEDEPVSTENAADPATEVTEAAPPVPAPENEFIFRPILGFSGGMLTYYGDISKGMTTNGPLLSNLAGNLRISFPLKSSFYFTLHTLFGTLSANERGNDRNANFKTQLNVFGGEFSYNFNHFLKSKRVLDPYVSVGFDAFLFNSKTDLLDANGQAYHYWKDGTIRNQADLPENRYSAVVVQRDYEYETDLRENAVGGLPFHDKYNFMIPVGVGVNMRMNEHLHARMGATWSFMLTDVIDGVTKETKGIRQGNAQNDNMLFIHVGLAWDMSKRPKEIDEEGSKSDISVEELAALTEGDEDADGVINLLDECPNSPAGVAVDEKGCPPDTDKDGIPDYRDLDPNTPEFAVVDSNGVALTDEQLEAIYLRFIDSTGHFASIEDTIYSIDVFSARTRRYAGGSFSVAIKADSISPAQAEKLLAEGDVKTVPDGKETALLVGKFDNLPDAVQKSRELKKEGIGTGAIVEQAPIAKVGAAGATGLFISGAKAKNLDNTGAVFRVQVGAFKNKPKEGAFADVPDVVSIVGEDGINRYYSGSFTTFEQAAARRRELLQSGYADALVKVFADGTSSIVPGTTVGSASIPAAGTPVNKDGVKFKIQLGAYGAAIPMNHFNEFVKLGKVSSEKGSEGLTRYFVGEFASYDEAKAFNSEMTARGINGSFVVGDYQGKTIKAQEAVDLLKR